ncbi:hypothetical protein K523DRAFT_339176 [Schizophyllum commune Tattone D]|nr:hypothetical protein K523DRAFT_339176 [Schizophyllum commune Tattone D]
MQSPLEALPDNVLAKLVKAILDSDPSSAPLCLASLGSLMHTASAAELFSHLRLLDDDAALALEYPATSRSNAFALLSNPLRYGWAVRTFELGDPAPEVLQDESYRPIDADELARLLRACPDIEEFLWTSSMPPPDGLCEMLMDKPQLRRFIVNPSHPEVPPARHLLAKWDALSLPCLSGLSCLEISRPLTQSGAHSLSALLTSLAPTLECLSLDFVWLDDSICEDIAALSRLRKLRLSTGGTKLTDGGAITLMEGCDALQEFILDDVEGRLSRCLWTKPLSYPKQLHTLQIIFSEAEHHHSWSADHLASIHEFPLENLTSLSVTRRLAPPTPDGVYIRSTVGDAVALRPLPQDLLDKLSSCASMKNLDLDFWSCSIGDAKTLVQKCQQLETLRICLDAPFLKLLGLASSFSLLSNLRTLSVSVVEEHAPGKAPIPSVPGQSAAITKGEDESMPSTVRDIKKFARKIIPPFLIQWYGHGARGSWAIEHSATASKLGPTVTVEYSPPSIPVSIWQIVQTRAGWTADHHDGTAYRRAGHDWAGDLADSTIARTELEHPSVASGVRKARAPSLSLSSSSSSGDTSLNLLATPPSSALFSPSFLPGDGKGGPPSSPELADDQIADDVPSMQRRSPGRPRRRVTSDSAKKSTMDSSSTGAPRSSKGGVSSRSQNGHAPPRRDTGKASTGRTRGGRRNSERAAGLGEFIPPPTTARGGARGGRRRMSSA